MLGLAIFLPTIVAQAGNPTFTLYPTDAESGVVAEVHPGSSLERSFLVRNMDKKLGITLNIVKQILNYDGDKKNRIGMPSEWTTFDGNQESTKITLRPAEQRQVKVNIKVPKDAKEGLYKLDIASVLDDYDGNVKGGMISMSAAIGTGTTIRVSNSAPYTEEQPVSAGIFANWPIYLIGIIVIAGLGWFFRKKNEA